MADVQVDFEELLDSIEWVGSGEVAGLECNAYVCKTSGKIHWVGEGDDEEHPEGIEDSDDYVPVPRKSELRLGRSLALRFVEEKLPEAYDKVYGIFRKAGAFGRLKVLLEDAGQLKAWYEYEQAATELALREWCEENGFVPVGRK